MSRSPVASRSTPPAPAYQAPKTCTKDGATLVPGVAPGGRSVDECPKCHTQYPIGGGALPAGTKCPVKDCPGTIVSGRCDCCEKRRAFADANIPKRTCKICGGPLVTRGKLCGACRPIAAKASIVKHLQGAAGSGNGKRR